MARPCGIKCGRSAKPAQRHVRNPLSPCQGVPQPISQAANSAAIAQPVEHIIRNDGVGGSNPSCGTIGQSEAVR